MDNIRRAGSADAVRIAEILVFSYRTNFYPIFRSDGYYFSELNVPDTAQELITEGDISQTFVYDDGTVKGFVQINGSEIERLFVEPCLCGNGIGARLLEFAVNEMGADWLWALEKNERAVSFYKRHGFAVTGEMKPEEDTQEYLIKMKR